MFNPRSAAGRTGRRQARIEEHLESLGLSTILFRPTRCPGDGESQARQLAEVDEVDLIVVVGGDGTLNEVANGVLRSQRPTVPVALVPAGTGGDFARMLTYGKGDWDGLREALGRPPVAIDVMTCRFAGMEEGRLALNVSGIGLAGQIVQCTNRGSKLLGGKLTFLLATFGALVRYRPAPFRLRWTPVDGGERHWEGLLANAFVANGRHCGGGMDMGPGADPTDGALQLVVVPFDNLWSLVRRLPYLYNGRIEQAPGLIVDRVSRIVATPAENLTLPGECDGEAPGDLPVDISFAGRKLQMFGIRQ